ncbi:MAG TPA: ribonuclease Z [Candidatus Dormibacteraeota bacterium]|nr:ribonuclease Z [Candidatus Dormibacteraeota bacterium]
MRLAFLGTGSAFSLQRYNGSVAVDGRLLLDAGAPLLPHLHRVGIDPGAIEAVFLTHFHGDHVLGLPPFVLHRAFFPTRPLAVIGPPGVAEQVETLMRLAWGDGWREDQPIELTYHEAVAEGVVAGVRYESVRVDHGDLDCRGYRLHLEGRVLAYAGDSIASPPLDELVRGADVAITEATGPDPGVVHTSWAEAEALAARHPGTRFLFNHLFEGSVARAVQDLQVLDV